MPTYKVQKEWSSWVEIQIEAESFEEAIEKTEPMFAAGEGKTLPEGNWTERFWVMDTVTEETHSNIELPEEL